MKRRFAIALMFSTVACAPMKSYVSPNGQTGAASNSPVSNLPIAPTMLVGVPASSTAIALSWSDNSSNETGFVIERAASASGPFTQLARTAANVAQYVDISLTPATTYYYRITAVNDDGRSVPTAVETVTTAPPSVAVPSAPSSLAGTVLSSTSVKLTWNDNSSIETGFRVERSVDDVHFFAIGNLGPNAMTFTDSGLAAGTTYYYRVFAVGTAGDSAASPEVTVKTSGTLNTNTYTYLAGAIFSPLCVSCHTGSGGSGGVALDTYAGVLAVAVPGSSAQSRVYTAITGGSMPPSGSVTTGDVTALKNWIDAGALNN